MFNFKNAYLKRVVSITFTIGKTDLLINMKMEMANKK